MDLDQLKREKIKMQLKVLKLQEEYYTQKLKNKKWHWSLIVNLTKDNTITQGSLRVFTGGGIYWL